jgi:hypothetical protein
MSNKLTKEWFLAALMRALRTVAQTALSLITVGAAFEATDWLKVLSISGVAGVYSILTSFATGLPETVTNGTLLIDTTSNPDKDIYRLDLDEDLDKLATQKTVTLVVNAGADLSQK